MHQQKIIFSRIKAFQQQKKNPSALYMYNPTNNNKKKVHTTAFKKTSKNIVAAIS